jgi:hypothetical protein
MNNEYRHYVVSDQFELSCIDFDLDKVTNRSLVISPYASYYLYLSNEEVVMLKLKFNDISIRGLGIVDYFTS